MSLVRGKAELDSSDDGDSDEAEDSGDDSGDSDAAAGAEVDEVRYGGTGTVG